MPYAIFCQFKVHQHIGKKACGAPKLRAEANGDAAACARQNASGICAAACQRDSRRGANTYVLQLFYSRTRGGCKKLSRLRGRQSCTRTAVWTAMRTAAIFNRAIRGLMRRNPHRAVCHPTETVLKERHAEGSRKSIAFVERRRNQRKSAALSTDKASRAAGFDAQTWFQNRKPGGKTVWAPIGRLCPKRNLIRKEGFFETIYWNVSKPNCPA